MVLPTTLLMFRSLRRGVSVLARGSSSSLNSYDEAQLWDGPGMNYRLLGLYVRLLVRVDV